MENTETRVWLDFACACKYISPETKERIDAKSEEVGKMLNHMIENPQKYARKKKNIVN